MTEPAGEYDREHAAAAVDALVAVAMSAQRLRIIEREGFTPEVKDFVLGLLWESLDRLEMTDPALFAQFASQDAAWIEEHRRRGRLPEEPRG
jgi:hypothetical protein